jgi:hypothetical protein
MKVEEHDQANADPQVENQIGAASDAYELSHKRAVRWDPDEVNACKTGHN